MSGDVLRRAARLMRERAEAATPGPWHIIAPHGWDDRPDLVGKLVSGSPKWDDFCSRITPAGGDHGDDGLNPDDAEHIASWHPAVALAVADWLDLEVLIASDPKNHAEISGEALAVARAYLGANQ